MFKDIRADYGSTSTILTEHLRAVDVNISERTATAMLYAIKSDTLFFNRQTNRVDLEAFSFLYPLADAALIRKMEGAEITLERLDYVIQAQPGRHHCASRCSARSSARRRAKTSSPTSPTSSCSSKTSSGRSSPASSNDSLIVSGAEPRLLEERRRVREALVRRHRQRRRPPRDGQGGGADASSSARSSAISSGRAITAPHRARWPNSSCTSRADGEEEAKPVEAKSSSSVDSGLSLAQRQPSA